MKRRTVRKTEQISRQRHRPHAHLTVCHYTLAPLCRGPQEGQGLVKEQQHTNKTDKRHKADSTDRTGKTDQTDKQRHKPHAHLTVYQHALAPLCGGPQEGQGLVKELVDVCLHVVIKRALDVLRREMRKRIQKSERQRGTKHSMNTCSSG
jgi:hypothetical protein